MTSSQRPAVLLLQPPVYDFALFDLFLKPLALMRMARCFENGGYSVHFINGLDIRCPETEKRLKPPKRKSNGTGKFFREEQMLPPHIPSPGRPYARYGISREALLHRLSNFRPDLILITSGMTYWYPGVRECVELCRRVHPGIPVVIGGIYASLLPGHCQNVCGPDTVVKGPLLPGIIPFLESVGLPLPEKRPGDTAPPLSDGPESASVLRLNEGCPMKCRYCASALINPDFIPGDTQNVLMTIRQSLEQNGTRHFAFYDDALLINKEKGLLPLLREIISLDKELNFYTPNALHIRHLDLPTIHLMKRAGFQEIRMGFEAKNEKKYDMDHFKRVMGWLKKEGFTEKKGAVYILAGLPGQQRDEVEASIRYAKESGAYCRIAQYSPVPGTPLWEPSVRQSPYPLAEEPLFHNNTYYSTEHSGLTRGDIEELRRLCLK